LKEIARVRQLSGQVTVPPSKSLTNRALLLGMVTEGPTTIIGPLDSDDSRFMVECVRRLGFEVEGSLRKSITIGPRVRMYAQETELFVGNAGTAMRFLTGFLPFVPGRYLLRGEQRMHERPIGPLVDALRNLGGEIEYVEKEGYPPISIRGRMMRGGLSVDVDGSLSSQFVSALMMGGATLRGGMRLRVRDAVSTPYILLTAAILRQFGAEVTVEGETISVRADALERDDYSVEGDYSSASYWMALAAVSGGRLGIEGLELDSAQGDARFIEVLREMGVSTEWTEEGVLAIEGGALHGGTFDMNDIPDTVPTLAAIAPLATSPVEIVNVANLRIKESDRIAALASELGKLGATVEEREDGLLIQPGWGDHPTVIDPHGDHRLAMAFAVAGAVRGNVSIDHEQVVSKSYPGFWRTLARLLSEAREAKDER
jgi:3-phosphoshikimate 1-carboxyvinyltransferase